MSLESVFSKAVTKYRYPDIMKSEVRSVVQHYPGLKPTFTEYVFNDGKTMELICLKGVIPVTYKENQYNIPVEIYVQDAHPYATPIAYVKPTQDMCIKPSRNVNENGLVFLPYLHEWKPNQSDLLGLVQVMCVVFGDCSPVYTRRRPQANTPVNNTRPAYPPPAGYYGGAPQPPYPVYTGTSNPSPGYPAAPAGGYYPTGATSSPSAMPPYPPISQIPSYPSQHPPVNRTGTISEEHIRASLISGVEDKVRRRYEEKMMQYKAEIEVLQRTETDLQKGKRQLEEMCTRLRNEQNELDRTKVLLQEKKTELNTAVAKLAAQGEMDIEEAVTPTAPLYNQIFNLYAEENAIQDAIYYLGEALRCDAIDLEVFLKQIRELSRKQFFLSALLHKCRRTAGLAA
ncbi:unnamed protein product [Cyprideis torosa]|uniref:Uncharacterized protein n=1 Tax=Cyprideis torosa TaxID=163714 RepID=A0A7R8ZUM4_9CRUS|nr:unnamed protein product [Cyprideis torosa]CAG0900527.1 unnamed protein product [Cyprideis torosa]